jgi:hypothetical protein
MPLIGKGQPNIQPPFGAMTGRTFGGGGGGFMGGVSSQFSGMRKRPLFGDLMGQGRGGIRGQQPQVPGGLGGFGGGAFNALQGDQPLGGFARGALGKLQDPPPDNIGGRVPIPGWPGDFPIADGQGGMGPRQLINYQGLPGFNSFQDSFAPGPIPGRRRIDMDPGQYGQGLQYKDPAMLQQMSDRVMSNGATRGRFSRGGRGVGQGFGEGYPGDALRRLLEARTGGGGF